MSNKTDVLSFDNWYAEAKKLNNDGFSAKDFFEAGQQSKQAEINELQKRIDELKMANHNLSVMTAEAESYSDYWKYERDKLQKRIDTVLDYIEPIDEISHKAYRELYKILKGDQL